MQTNEYYVKSWAAFECGINFAKAEQYIELYRADYTKFGKPNAYLASNVLHYLNLALRESEKADLAPELKHRILLMHLEIFEKIKPDTKPSPLIDLDNFDKI